MILDALEMVLGYIKRCAMPGLSYKAIQSGCSVRPTMDPGSQGGTGSVYRAAYHLPELRPTGMDNIASEGVQT